MGVQIRGGEALKALFEGLGKWVGSDSRNDVNRGAEGIAKDLRTKIANGQGADGSPLAPLKKSTLEGPVRRDGDPQKRSASGSIPLKASGKTADSIRSQKTGFDEWEISSATDRGDMILSSNASQTHSGKPFAGDTPKPIRDPLQVTDKQMDLLEDELLKGIDRALNG